MVVTSKNIVICNKCGKTNLVPRDNVENFVICFNCRKRINTHKSSEHKQIEEIKYFQILKNISKQITKTGYSFIYDKLRRCWLINIDNKIIPILIPEVSNSNFILANSEKEGTLFIMLDKNRCKPFINPLNASQFIEFADIYDNADFLKTKIKEISEVFDQNISIELERKFSEFVEKLSPSKFEKFCVSLLQELKNKNNKLSSFYNYLNRKENTIINSKIIMLGGPSNPDFYIMNLNNYLQSGLRTELFGEVKRYKKSRFTFEDFSKAIVHANNKPSLFLLSTNDVQIEVWMKIIENYKNGKFLHVLLDKDLILLLIKCLDLHFLIKEN